MFLYIVFGVYKNIHIIDELLIIIMDDKNVMKKLLIIILMLIHQTMILTRIKNQIKLIDIVRPILHQLPVQVLLIIQLNRLFLNLILTYMIIHILCAKIQ